MTIEIVAERQGRSLLLAVVEDGALVDLWTQDTGPQAVDDRLFLARVTGIEAALDGAFLDHGGERAGYITGKDARFRRGLSKKVSVKHSLDDGEWLVVQGLRDAEGDKGARFSTDLRLVGPSLIYRPFGDEVTTTRHIRPADRDRAVERGRALLAAAGAKGGLVLRRSALAQDDAGLAAELAQLVDAWAQVAAVPAAARRKAGPIAAGPSPFARLLWRALELAPDRLVLADPALAALPEDARPELDVLPGKETAFAATGVDTALAEALARAVALPRGGRLIIEETQACVAIDVDSGGRPALEVNLEAAAVLGRLVRLRNLGGTLIVDFVDLTAKPQRQRLEQALERAFRGDPLPVQIYPMSPLGIVQISRARRGGQPLAALGRLCPTCGGSGRVAG
jgi:ribonuclease G